MVEGSDPTFGQIAYFGEYEQRCSGDGMPANHKTASEASVEGGALELAEWV